MRILSLAVFSGAVVGLLTACDDSAVVPADVQFSDTVRHASGFRLELPDGYEAVDLEAGLLIWDEFAGRITPSMTFSKRSAPPDLPGAERLSLDGVGDVYRVLEVSDNPGSGGARHEMIAWRALGDDWIVLEAVSLVEWPEAGSDYGIAWAVFASVAAE